MTDAQAAGGQAGAILKNTAILFAVQALTRIVNFVYFIYLAKSLGVTEFGYLNVVLSFALLFDVLGDIGLSRYVLRESAIDVRTVKRDIQALLPLRLLTAGAAYCVMLLQAWLFYPPLVVQVTAIVALGLFIAGPAAIFESALQGRSNFVGIAIAHTALTIVQVGSGTAVIWAGGGVVQLAFTFVLTNLAFCTVVAIGVGRVGIPVRFRLDLARCRAILPMAAPYAVVFGLFILSSRLELLTLGWLGSGAELGLYGVAARMMEAALVVPLALGAVLAPNFTQLHHASQDKLGYLYARMFRLTLFFAVPGAMAAVELAGPVMSFLLSDKYAGVEQLMRILFAAYPFAAIYYLNLSLLLGSRRQVRTAALMGGLVAAQLLICLAAVPTFGAGGAAGAFAGTMVMFSIASTVAVKHWYVANAPLARAAAPILAAALPLAWLAFGNGLTLNWILDIAGLLVYGIIVLVLVRRLDLTDPEPAGV